MIEHALIVVPSEQFRDHLVLGLVLAGDAILRAVVGHGVFHPRLIVRQRDANLGATG